MRLPPLITPPLFIASVSEKAICHGGYKGRSPLKNLFKKRESPSHACEGTYISYVWAREGVGGGFIITSPPAGETRGWASPSQSKPAGERGEATAQAGRPTPKIPAHEVQRDFPGLRCQPPRSALCGGIFCPARARARRAKPRGSFLPCPGTDGFQVFVTEILGWL